MKTPDGKQFKNKARSKDRIRVLWAGFKIGAAIVLRVLLNISMVLLRAIGKFIITTWRLAAALDSALWRATKLVLHKLINGLIYVAVLGGKALHSLVLWLPTRTGRAYSAVSGVFLLVAGLWIADELRTGLSGGDDGQMVLRAPVDDADPILARIEGRYVHLSEIEAAARAAGFLRPTEMVTPHSAFERGLVQAYVQQRLLAAAALDEGLQRAPSVMRQINAARDRILAASYMDTQVAEKVTPQTVERFYQAQRDVTVLGDEVRARHILVATGEEASEVIAALDAGGDFKALARERSLDRATAPLGGEIGWFTRAMMTPVFARVAFSTPAGERAAPFQTEFGWHIMEVQGRRKTNAVPFAEVRGEIEEFLRMHAIDEALESLSEESQVVYYRPANEPSPTDLDLPDLTSPELVNQEEAPEPAGAADTQLN